ncbi:MAG TPA: ABC transporter ATP-binding protein [Symbiobacteriaceae bacterium]|jgi:putative ABC transport system ATP-binding protein
MAIVEVQGLTKVYGLGAARVEALRGIDLAIDRGEFVAIMGPSGSGKSTLLQIMGGLDAPTDGTVQVAGKSLGTLTELERTLLRRERIGFVFQAYNLISVLTAAENVALPLTLAGRPAAEVRSRSERALQLVGLTERGRHLPEELSGGQQQRVAIARALAAEPAMLLADEPTGNLDSRTGTEVMVLLRRSCDELGQTVVLVTHDPRAAGYADRVVFLEDGVVAAIRAGKEVAVHG